MLHATRVTDQLSQILTCNLNSNINDWIKCLSLYQNL